MSDKKKDTPDPRPSAPRAHAVLAGGVVIRQEAGETQQQFKLRLAKLRQEQRG